MDVFDHMYKMQCSGNSAVMRGTYGNEACIMKVMNVTTEEGCEQVATEIAVYRRLQDLQGNSIPKFLGYGNLCGVVDILILEACGEPDYCATVDVLKELLQQIHARGFLHGDVELRNVVCHARRGHVLIDFGCSKVDNISEREKEDEMKKAREVCCQTLEIEN